MLPEERINSMVELINEDLPVGKQVSVDKFNLRSYTISLGLSEVVKYNCGDNADQVLAFLTGLMWGRKIGAADLI